MRAFSGRSLSGRRRLLIKSIYNRARRFACGALLGYDGRGLEKALLKLGVRKGDTLMVHSAFSPFNGFRGGPVEIIDCLIGLLGSDGNLLMPSMPYRTSSSEYLQRNDVFDVRKTPSRMGLITELFRRRPGTKRSLSPTHPVLALGRDSDWITEGHERCEFPCGKGSPFEKFRSLGGKILFFGIPFNTLTFIHHMEDLLRDRLPLPVYAETPLTARMRDIGGREITVRAYCFSDAAVRSRRPGILERRLLEKKLLGKTRIGATVLMLVSAEDAVRCAREMLDDNICFYEGVGTSCGRTLFEGRPQADR